VFLVWLVHSVLGSSVRNLNGNGNYYNGGVHVCYNSLLISLPIENIPTALEVLVLKKNNCATLLRLKCIFSALEWLCCWTCRYACHQLFLNCKKISDFYLNNRWLTRPPTTLSGKLLTLPFQANVISVHSLVNISSKRKKHLCLSILSIRKVYKPTLIFWYFSPLASVDPRNSDTVSHRR